jgi:hypothetical protein
MHARGFSANSGAAEGFLDTLNVRLREPHSQWQLCRLAEEGRFPQQLQDRV